MINGIDIEQLKLGNKRGVDMSREEVETYLRKLAVPGIAPGSGRNAMLHQFWKHLQTVVEHD